MEDVQVMNGYAFIMDNLRKAVEHKRKKQYEKAGIIYQELFKYANKLNPKGPDSAPTQMVVGYGELCKGFAKVTYCDKQDFLMCADYYSLAIYCFHLALKRDDCEPWLKKIFEPDIKPTFMHLGCCDSGFTNSVNFHVYLNALQNADDSPFDEEEYNIMCNIGAHIYRSWLDNGGTNPNIKL